MDIQPELPDRLARDLDGAFEELVRGHERLVFGLALRVVGDRADAEEVAQDTFERAYHALAGYEAERVAAMRLRPWLALGVVGDRGDAEEVAQDTFERAYHALAGYEAERVAAMRLRPWLARIALNLARNRLRRRPPPARSLEDGDGQPLAVAGPADAEPAQVAERGQERELLVGLLAALPRPYREAVVLRHVEGLPYAEVAEVLGRPVGTVKTHVHRGVRQLRVELENRKERVPR